jgi:hypothetical protein
MKVGLENQSDIDDSSQECFRNTMNLQSHLTIMLCFDR